MEKQFKYVIVSEHNLFDLHLRETFRYRDLIFLFVKRDFIAMYKQTVLGPMWALIQPLLTTIMFTIIFGSMAKLTIADAVGDFAIPGFLFYMAGSICWAFFSSVVEETSNTFLHNRKTMGKVYYPRLAAPIAAALSRLISFGIQLALFLIIWLVVYMKGESTIQITPRLLLLPLIILHMIILSVGTGIVISSVTTKYRDLALLVGFGLQLWQYGSPVAYGLCMVPESMRGWYMLNPLTPILTAFRWAVFGFGYFHLGWYGLSWITSLLICFCGVMIFSKVERAFMDTI